MGLTYAKEEQLRKQPIMESFTRKSEDGRYLVHKIVITDIKPVAYMQKVLANEADFEEDEEA
jgi:hypothetical protein